MKLYNMLTRKKEELKPLEKGKINMFVCGPTVYDLSHLGHAKTYIQMDILARTLRASGYEVFYLQNITDLDDKIIARANEQQISWEQLRSKFESEYYKDMKALGNDSVTQYARATDYIDDIIKQVQTLLDKGYAYEIEGDGIYFEVATFKDYGKLSGRKDVKEDDAQTRIDESDKKRGWNDFCLWKFSKPGEPVWDAPFGNGRPGWHIEDTAITEHFFGQQYDIHGGAVDLIFPHHEAEITQMESVSGKSPFVQYWVHSGFLNINKAKMSKSKKNFFTIREVLDKGYDPQALRLFFLQSHYRSPIDFSWENLDAAQNRLKNWQAIADLRWQATSSNAKPNRYAHIINISRALDDDIDTPLVLALLEEIFDDISTNGLSQDEVSRFNEFLSELKSLLGIDLREPDISTEQKQLIADREAARDSKDWAKSDELRDQLKEQGIDVRDTDHGPIWSRV